MADVIITPASGLIDFQNTSGISSATIQLDGNGNLALSAAGGDIQIGDTSADIFIGDGINNVDLIFEEDGEIRGLTGKTITLGQSDSFISFAGDITGNVDFTGTLTAGQNGKIVFPDNTTIPDNPTNEQHDYITFGANGSISQVSGRGALLFTSSDDSMVIANGDVGRAFTNSTIDTDPENIYILSDGNFYVKTDLQEGFGTEHTLLFDNAGGFSLNGNTIWHAGNDGAGSGLDADTLDGAQPSVSASNSTIVQRHSSGYIYANYFNTTPNDVSSGVTRICCETGNDGFIRHATADAVRAFIDDGRYLRSNATDSFSGTITNSGNFISSAGAISAANFNKIRLGRSDSQFMSFYGDATGNAMISISQTSNPKANVRIGYSVDGGASIAASYTFTGSSGTVWTSGNDGAGSGLDADTIDGTQLSNLMTLSGTQTITGDKDFDGTVTYDLLNGPSASTRDKIRVYPSGSYTIGMQSGISFGGLNDWAMTFQFNDDSDRGFWWGDTSHSTAQGAMALRTDGRLTVAHSLRIGYGESDTTNPGATHRLDVSGSILATSNITAYSDINLKKNIEVIPNALNKVSQISGVTFDRIDLEDESRQSGVIAQEVEKVLPEVVRTTQDGTKTVAYGNMVGLLIEAIKEQQKQIDDLKAKLEEGN